MLESSHDFGRELRKRRMAAQWSLEQLGQRVHYSKSQLSKVERGLKRPTSELARLCDTVLKADGALTALVPVRQTRSPLLGPGQDDEVWLMHLGKDGSAHFQAMTRRSVIAAGATSVLTMGMGDALPLPGAGEGAATLVDASQLLFAQFRRLGQASGPAGVLPSLIAQTHTLEQLAMSAGPRTRRSLLLLASRYAEYAGWMAQECGDDVAALWWTDRAVRFAEAGGDTALSTYAHVRHSLISLYRGNVAQALQLSARAVESNAPARIRGLAAQHLAQGSAVDGDYDTCMRSLDQARELLARDVADPGQPVLGASHVPDVVSMFTGWCLFDLGRPRAAAALLDKETARIPEHAFRTRARYGVRRALAHAAAGDVDHACEIAAQVFGSIRLTRSATVATDLRRLAHALGRNRQHPSVRSLMPDLADALAYATTS
ncbi:multiprotein-bridging factor 1 family protein [Streptomyces sp. NPDC059009]|uniref:helix-turn-helix domain-containing protein n=1 Tax=Streptomyces sp. NPDC059009 TaxID=3346694 RepID=UPI0036838AD0